MSVQNENSVKGHFALYDTKSFRSRCKMTGCTRFSHLFCEECMVHLCITSKRNCFYEYHHNSKSEENNTARQNKQNKAGRQTIKTTNANDERSGARRTSGAVNKRKKNPPKGAATRSSIKNRIQKCAKEQIIAKNASSQKENFMSKIGLITKKLATR